MKMKKYFLHNRRIGTRRQRIQARHDTQVTRLKESPEEKRRKALIQVILTRPVLSLIKDSNDKWRDPKKKKSYSKFFFSHLVIDICLSLLDCFMIID